MSLENKKWKRWTGWWDSVGNPIWEDDCIKIEGYEFPFRVTLSLIGKKNRFVFKPFNTDGWLIEFNYLYYKNIKDLQLHKCDE